MMNAIADYVTGIALEWVGAAAYVVIYVALFLVARWLKDLLTPYKLSHELTKKDNLAVALTMCGYYFGVAIVFAGAIAGPSQGFVVDLIQVSTYSLLGIAFLNLSRVFNERVILRKFSHIEQLTTEQNTAVGAVQFGVYIATGCIAAGSITGTGGGSIIALGDYVIPVGGFVTTLVFFLLGQFSFLAFALLYDLITPYSIHEELKNKNSAAGAAFGGTLIALGIIVSIGVSGNFESWGKDLLDLVVVNVMAFTFLPILRFIMDKLVIPGDKLNREITEDRNVGAGLLEATVAVSFAVVLRILLN